MNIQVHRINDDGVSTIGFMTINGEFQCFTLEDTFNEPKVYGKTRIPEGSYEVTLRHEGSMVKKYDDRYDGHDGMLWLRNVDSFEYVYIHVGNDDDDTDGCLLVGRGCNTHNVQTVTGSVLAYTTLYPIVYNEIKAGRPVNIEVY